MTEQSKPSGQSTSSPSVSGVCLACGGRGVISNGTEDVKCGACGGNGKS